MNLLKWNCVTILGFGLLAMAACDSDRSNRNAVISSNPMNRDAGSPASANRQQCIDAGYETGTVQYQQCVTQGRGLED